MKHGVGIVDHIEDRIVGLKVRDIYEVPAAAILLPAHAELERLVGTIHQNHFKSGLDQQWAYLVYAGLWWEPLRTDLDAYMNEVNRYVTGKIGMKLYKGMARVVTRESPNAVYDAAAGDVQRRRAGCSPSRRRRASSSCGRCSRGWLGVCATRTAGRTSPDGLQDPGIRRLERRQVVRRSSATGAAAARSATRPSASSARRSALLVVAKGAHRDPSSS